MTNTMRVGVNLTFEFQREGAFLNKVKQSQFSNFGASISGGGRELVFPGMYNANSNGFPTDMVRIAGGTYTEFDFSTMKGTSSPYFKAGHWVCKWVGSAATSCFTFQPDTTGGGAFSIVSSAANRIVFDVPTPTSAGGISVLLSGIDGSNTITDLAIVHEDYESLYNAGEVVDPDWLEKFGRFQAFRFMDWFNTNFNVSTGYPVVDPSWIFWGNTVPTEVCVAFCNKAMAHAYFNIPALIDDPAVIDLATRVLSGHTDNNGRFWPGLNGNLDCYIEYFNEVWNAYSYDPNTEMKARGALLFPGYLAADSRMNAYSFCRTVQTENIWKDVWGGSSRVKRIQGGFHDGDDGGFTLNSLPEGGPDAGGAGYTFTANCSISGTTLTVVSGFSGTMISYTDGATTNGAGQLITGTNVLPQTYLESHISGTGNGSTWTVSKSHSATGTQAMAGAYWPAGTRNRAYTDYLAEASYASSFNNPGATTLTQVFDGINNIGVTFTASIDDGAGGVGTTMTVASIAPGGLLLMAGQPIIAGAATGTTIVRQVSRSDSTWGRGGIYTVNIAQLVASSTLTAQFGGMWVSLCLICQSKLGIKETYGDRSVVQYEGGYGDTSNDGTYQSLMLQAKADHRMYDMYIQMMNVLQLSDGISSPLFMQFNDCQSFNFIGNPGGIYSCVPNTLTPITDASTQEYLALVNFIGSQTTTVTSSKKKYITFNA